MDFSRNIVLAESRVSPTSMVNKGWDNTSDTLVVSALRIIARTRIIQSVLVMIPIKVLQN